MRDYFPRYAMKPNTECENRDCVKHQGEYMVRLAAAPKVTEKKEEIKKPKHESNEARCCATNDSGCSASSQILSKNSGGSRS